MSKEKTIQNLERKINLNNEKIDELTQKISNLSMTRSVLERKVRNQKNTLKNLQDS